MTIRLTAVQKDNEWKELLMDRYGSPKNALEILERCGLFDMSKRERTSSYCPTRGKELAFRMIEENSWETSPSRRLTLDKLLKLTLAHIEAKFAEAAKGKAEKIADDLGDYGGFGEAFKYLDSLRDTGVTNMFGAGVFLKRDFGTSTGDSRKILAAWMETFEARNPEGPDDRVDS